ncbi:hypothetical protein [Actinospica robiniae]|uniref:hypothetical protein n=1 Tax=Actinospica robiniae TaxID=304901 RepID=UPI000408A342|nr:hypothetical protein [Actinospica robiniae]
MERVVDPATIDFHDFLVRWRGSPDTAPRRVEAEFKWLPRPLLDWFEFESQWTRRYQFGNNLYRPEQIVATGKAVIFMTDPTADWLWAFDLDDPDIVYERELYDGWTEVAERMPEFLVHNALSEAVYGGAVQLWADRFPDEHLDELLAPLSRVGFGGWGWPGAYTSDIHLGDRILAEVTYRTSAEAGPRKDPAVVHICVAATDTERLDYLDGLAEVRWRKRGRVWPD